MTITKLPFKLSTDATADWLQSLSQLSSVNSANQLNKAVKQLRSIKTDTGKVLEILVQLTPTVLYICSNIEATLQKGSDKSQKIEKLGIQLLRNLSLAFCSYTTQDTISTDKKNQAIYIALQLIGYTQRLAAIFHQFPSATLWKKTGELYTLANGRNILKQLITHKIRDFKNLTTAEDVLKRNILFAILAPYQHNSSEVKELFSISEQHSHLLKLNTENSPDNIFCWDLESEIPPHTKDSTHQQSDSHIKINATELLSLLRSTNFSFALDKETLALIIEKISGYKDPINTSVPSALIINHLIVGLGNISTYLEKLEKLNKIERLSSQIIDSNPIKKMSLEPMEHEKSHLNPATDFKPSNNSLKLLQGVPAVKMLQTKKDQYIIAETNPINSAIGDIILLCLPNLNLGIGIIRQIKLTNQSGTIHILIEKTSGIITAHLIDPPEASAKHIIVIQKDNSTRELFIAPSKLSNGTQIKSASGQSFTLDSLIDFSPFYMHYRIS